MQFGGVAGNTASTNTFNTYVSHFCHFRHLPLRQPADNRPSSPESRNSGHLEGKKFSKKLRKEFSDPFTPLGMSGIVIIRHCGLSDPATSPENSHPKLSCQVGNVNCDLKDGTSSYSWKTLQFTEIDTFGNACSMLHLLKKTRTHQAHSSNDHAVITMIMMIMTMKLGHNFTHPSSI